MNTIAPPHAQKHHATAHFGPRLTPWFLWVLTAALLLATAALDRLQAAGAPNAVNYQGRLVSSTGEPLKSGNYQVQFKIWSSPTDKQVSSYVWGRVFPVHVATNGMFNILLNDFGTLVADPGTPLVQDLLQAFEGSDRYLGLSVASTPEGGVSQITEIIPRQQLASAPFAIHSHISTWTDRATNAINAAFATVANNATNFSAMSTNDFLWVKNKTSQSVDGTVTIKQDLNVAGNVSVTNALTVKGNSSLTGTLTAGGTIHADGGLSGSNAFKWAGSAPIVIKTVRCPDLAVGSTTSSLIDTGYATNQWTAIVGGFYWDADIAEGGYRKPWIELKMVVRNNKWSVAFYMTGETSAISEIYVDVMFIRREWVDDQRMPL